MSQKLIVTIIKKGYVKKMLDEAKKIGLEGQTVINGRGTVNPHMYESLVGLTYNPSRDIMLNVVKADLVPYVLDVFKRVGKLESSNTGISFVIDVKEVEGLALLISEGLA